ncbi:MAG: hypothetical protein WCQ99_11010 [Pseudomonadota bacterium]
MNKAVTAVLIFLLICAGSSMYVPEARANGWANAGKILAVVAGADLLFNGGNSMAARTVAGAGHVFTGGALYAQPASGAYYYRQPAPRRCWEEVRRIPAYDSRGNFLGYFDKRVTVCSDY